MVIVGATNRPEELDEAARRRFVKRIYVPLPDLMGRSQLYRHLLAQDEEEDRGSILGRDSGVYVDLTMLRCSNYVDVSIHFFTFLCMYILISPPFVL